MLEKELKKIRHNIPELSEWSNEDISILLKKVQTLKSDWRKSTSDYDTLLTLGAALDWSEKSHKTPGHPELDRPPSTYIEVGQTYRETLRMQSKNLADKAQAWGGFWDPEDEKSEDENGWVERDSSIAPHIWIGLKKRGFLPHINNPLEYERESLKGLENCCALLLKIPKLTPTLSLLQRTHRTLFKNISNQAGEFTDAQLFTGGYVGADPRLISYELNSLSKQYEKGMKTAKKMGTFKDAKIIRTVAFTCARLLRIQPFKEGNKRIIAAWALCTLAREVSIPKVDQIKSYKDLHLTFKELRKGKLTTTAKKLCRTFGVSNPEPEVPSFWLSPSSVKPKQIETKEWENKNNTQGGNSVDYPNNLLTKTNYRIDRIKKRQEELALSGHNMPDSIF